MPATGASERALRLDGSLGAHLIDSLVRGGAGGLGLLDSGHGASVRASVAPDERENRGEGEQHDRAENPQGLLETAGKRHRSGVAGVY